ncbi:T9SS type A sorting domain-containing protein [Flavobacterium lacus]|uniref:Putative delta-60 repeat protein/predicted secreted protein (Por secretion system target) n=1 Tax=Flavobacterium lacus TaxID=1353778 RepID=A0A328WSR9_9FLAO|nr:T9SS type A sorting domain-containing protein [Flavobacterium lacus]RAR46904.1 putative delta-60 repeat protein/predicted secreted protein (Por secretion system target) [Flavobacterium lacus]
MKKILCLILLCNLSLFSQNIDNTFNLNNNGPFNENIGGSGIILDDGNILTYNGLPNLYNSNGSIINDPDNYILPIPFSSLVKGSNGKLVAFNRWNSTDFDLKVYNSNGLEDTNFITPIFQSTFPPVIHCAKIDSDGKVIVSGSFNYVNGISRKNMVRLNPDGSVDTSFINLDEYFNFTGSIYSFAIQSDGKYVIGGQFLSGFSGNFHNIELARLNYDGTVDNSFYDFTNQFYGLSDPGHISKIIVQTNGKILLLGPNFINGSTILSRGITRLNSNGSRDTTFNSLDISYANDAVILDNGKMIVAHNGNFLKKINSNGTIDNSFNYQNTELNYLHEILQLCPDGKILVNSSYKSSEGITREKIHKINSSGDLDFSFNPQQSTNKTIQNMAVLNDGSILVQSPDLTSYNDTPCKSIIKLNTEGAIDNSFNLDPQIQEITSGVFHFKEFSNNKILIAAGSGSANGRIYINSIEHKFIRLNEDGTIDNTFNPTISSDLRFVEITNDDKILYRNYNDNKIYRLNYDGSFDDTFTPYNFFSSNSFKRFNDGSLYSNGSLTSSGTRKIYKLNPDGTINNSFNAYVMPGYGYSVKHYQKQGDKLIVNYDDNFIKRLNSDGSLDTSFNDFTSGCSKIIINSENKIIIAYSNQLKKYSIDGVLEGVVNFEHQIFKIYQQFCDKILVQLIYNYNESNYTQNFDNLKRYDISQNASFVNTPIGPPIQNFSNGDTLENLNVIGENISWFSDQLDCVLNLNVSNSTLNSDTPLPINTVLVNNTTYYATQTINGIESTYRLPIKAISSLNIVEPTISNIKIINPVKDFLKISGDNLNIKKVEIYSLIGNNIKTYDFNEVNEVEIDLKDLISNLYLVKIYSNESVKIVKIIKE